ncbi:MAG: hypothetical protein KC503_23030 [Myxococcales bacterium]|nr:hypothetical protein [Myxococcales bacterium]
MGDDDPVFVVVQSIVHRCARLCAHHGATAATAMRCEVLPACEVLGDDSSNPHALQNPANHESRGRAQGRYDPIAIRCNAEQGSMRYDLRARLVAKNSASISSCCSSTRAGTRRAAGARM